MSDRPRRERVADPHAVPVVRIDTHLEPVPDATLQPQHLREQVRRRLQPDVGWSAERSGDGLPAATDDPLRPAAVLVPLVQRHDGLHVLLTRRTDHLHDHAGQISFPGGRPDPVDADLVSTALREAHEEIGVERTGVTPFALLPDLLIPVSDFVVTPVIAWWHEPGEIDVRDTREISAVHRIPIAELASARARCRVRHPSGYVAPGFEVSSMVVWGFTAGILDALLHGAGWEEPWDPERVLTLPG